MKLKTKEINEIINSDDELIGSSDTPRNGSNLESGANGTTDYNVKVAAQPYRYDMLGRFGFSLLPFFENAGNDDNENIIVKDIAKILYNNYMELLKHYYKNPASLKNDYRKKVKLDFDSDESVKHDFRIANEIIDKIKPHFEESLKKLDEDLKNEINEGTSSVNEKLIEKKDKKELTDKHKDKDILDNKIEKIADLVADKMDKKDIDKLIKLLETNNK